MNIKRRDLIAFAVGVVATGVVAMASMAIGGGDGWGDHRRFGDRGMMSGRGFGDDDQNGQVGGPMMRRLYQDNGQNAPQNNQSTPAPAPSNSAKK